MYVCLFVFAAFRPACLSISRLCPGFLPVYFTAVSWLPACLVHCCVLAACMCVLPD
jgi:hypothetical protein